MNWLDLTVFTVYLAGVTGLGAYFYRRAGTVKGFTQAEGHLPGWVVGLSIFGTYVSSISFLALPGKAYGGDWNVFAFSLSLPVAAWMASRWFAPLYRAEGDVSAYAFLERRFGAWARLYAMTCYLLTQFARVGTILFLVALATERLAGWDIVTIIIVTGALVTLYTTLGGIEAVIWTDAVQSAVLAAGAIICALWLLSGMPRGPDQLFDIAGAADKFSLGSAAMSFTAETVWVTLLYGLFINLQNFGIDQNYVQRYHATPTLHEARKSIWVGALLYLPISALFLFIGSGLYAFYAAQPELLPEALRASGMNDRVFPHFIVTRLPQGVVGVVIAAISAAAMSTISSSLNSSATVLMSDVYARFMRPAASDRERTRFLRVATVILGIGGTGAALAMISIKSALDVWWRLAGVASGGMLGLFLLAAFARHVGPRPAAMGVAAGVAVIVWATFSQSWGLTWANPLHPLMTVVIGTLVVMGVGLMRGQEKN